MFAGLIGGVFPVWWFRRLRDTQRSAGRADDVAAQVALSAEAAPVSVAEGTGAGFLLGPEGVAVAAELLFAEGPGANGQAGGENQAG